MDYEKKYKEALERAKNLHKDAIDMEESLLAKQCEIIFPELAESDDERIRKEIIATIHLYYGEPLENEAKEMIVWLEKQGENISLPKFTFDDVLALQCAMEAAKKVQKDKDLYEQLESLHDRLHDAYWLEKQDQTFTKKDVDDAYLKGLCDAKQELEKQGEQKPADKVEPKFHKGDWIVHHGTENIYQVVAVIDNQYQLKYGDNYTIQKCADVDKNARLWDISKDAKDGDVLCYKNEISLYRNDIKDCTKQETTFGGFVYYCCYDGNRFITDSLYSLTEQDKMDIQPATKEQRETLFKAKHEAGYEWDAEKKELKKIENEIEIPFGAKDSELEEVTYYISKGFHAEIDDDKVVIKKGEKPTAWSEEDEKKLRRAIRATQVVYPVAADWLKSLKDRLEQK